MQIKFKRPVYMGEHVKINVLMLPKSELRISVSKTEGNKQETVTEINGKWASLQIV